MQRDQQQPADHWLLRFQRFEATLSGIAGRLEGLDRFEQLLGGISERVASLVSAQERLEGRLAARTWPSVEAGLTVCNRAADIIGERTRRRFISEGGRCRRRWGTASSRSIISLLRGFRDAYPS